MNTDTTPLKLTMPTQTLLQNMPYVSADDTHERGILAVWLWKRSGSNPDNYPEFGYETDAAGRFIGE